MLEDPQVQKLMKQVAAGIFPATELLDVRAEPASDQDGKDALRITLVITDDLVDKLTGEQLADLLTEIRDLLLVQGDERFPLLHFATPTDNGVVDEDD